MNTLIIIHYISKGKKNIITFRGLTNMHTLIIIYYISKGKKNIITFRDLTNMHILKINDNSIQKMKHTPLHTKMCLYLPDYVSTDSFRPKF